VFTANSIKFSMCHQDDDHVYVDSERFPTMLNREQDRAKHKVMGKTST